MRNSYSDAASSDVPSHLFEWAVAEGEEAGDVAYVAVDGERKRMRLLESKTKSATDGVNMLSDACNEAVDALEGLGFSATYDISEGGVIIDFEDDVFDRRRVNNAFAVVEGIARDKGCTDIGRTLVEHFGGGRVVFGLMPGIGFGGCAGIDPDFNPYATRNVARVDEMDVSVDDDVLYRIDELVGLWDADAGVYNEAADIVVGGLDKTQRASLSTWIGQQINAVRVPGT